jgi:RNA polymerase sigma-70 factor, ECF subfamily
MDGDANSLASNTLIRLLRSAPDDPSARSQFVVRCGPKIFRWCRAWGLEEEVAQDLARTILARLAARLPDFVPEPGQGYCGWLWTLTEHSLNDVTARLRRRVELGGEADRLAELDRLEARQELRAELSAEFQLELIAEAKVRVQGRVSPRQWEAFRLTVIEGVSGAETAGRISMSVASVYNAKSKVLRQFQDEILRLNGPEASDRRESVCASTPSRADAVDSSSPARQP